MFTMPDPFPTKPGEPPINKDRGRSGRQDCPVPLNMDYKDHFFLSHADGEKELLLPNSREVQEYGTNEPKKGVIIFCHSGCDWGNCPEDFLLGGIEEKDLVITINGVPAVSYFDIGQTCLLLANEGGYFWEPNGVAPYHIRISVAAEKKFTQFGHMVVF